MKSQRTEVCVVGGGAAGLMAAVAASSAGAKTVLLEKGERPARKLCITGKGRCNLTNACTADEALANVLRNRRFLYSAFRAFPPEAVMAFFEGLGVPLKVERGRRVFPVSDRAADVAQALTREAERLGVALLRGRARGVILDEGRVAAVDCGELTVPCRAAILCTGGLSYPATGSTGDGYAIAEALGHTVAETGPSLAPLCSPDGDCAAMQGLSLRNVKATLRDGRDRAVFSELGEMQFTHFGVTGPLALSASAHMRQEERYTFELDLKPGLDEQKLDARLLRDFGEARNRDFKNALAELLPRLLIPVVVRRSGIPPETKVNAITRTQRRALLGAVKRFTVPISGLRPVEEAVVTRGGVEVKAVAPGSLASKLVRGLYFAGELLDVDAYTGGYNLQIAWATGRAAGLAAAGYAHAREETEEV